jgi:uncharacterized membrane protein YesL
VNWAERFPKLWGLLEQLALLLYGSLLFWLACPLIITMPGGITGLYGVLGPLVRTGRADGAILRPYLATFRRTALTGLYLFLLDLVVALLLWVDLHFFWATGALWGQVVVLLIGALGLVALMVNLYAWPLLAWYPQPLGSLLRRALLLAGAHPFLSLAGVALLLLLPVLLALLPVKLLILIPLLGPGLVVTALGAIAWRAMRRYAEEEEEAV